MSNPMTTRQAIEQHECPSCAAGEYCTSTGMCQHVESSTCSVMCSSCHHRVWFTGNLQDQAETFSCPYCGVFQKHRLLGGKR